MKSDDYIGAAQKVNTRHYNAMKSKVLITAVVFFSMYC